MLKVLIKQQLEQLGQIMFTRSGTRQRQSSSKAGTILLYVFVYGMVAVSFGSMLVSILIPLHTTGNDLLYFIFVAAFGFFIGIFTSMFTAQKLLYGSKDNDLLLSMPIPPRYILYSRLTALFVLEYASSFMITIPGIVVYAMFGEPKPLQMVIIVVASLVLPLAGLAITAALGRVLAAVTAKAKRKNIVQLVTSVVFLVVYFYVYSNMMELINTIAQNADTITDTVKWVLPLYRYAQACMGDIAALGLFILWCAIPFALVLLWLSKSFLKITVSNVGSVRVKYVKKELKVSSPLVALFKRELSHFANLPAYIINCALGSIMSVVIAVALIINADAFGALGETMPYIMSLLPCLALCAVTSMTCTTSVSVSLEGQSFQLLKSFPVKTKDVFNAKIGVNLAISLPTLFVSSVAMTIGLGMSVWEGIMTFLCASTAQLLIAVFGLLINVALPKLEWTNPIIVIKQSASVLVSVFGGMVLVAGPAVAAVAVAAVIGAFVPAQAALLTICLLFAVYALLTAVSALLLYTAGAKKFEKM